MPEQQGPKIPSECIQTLQLRSVWRSPGRSLPAAKSPGNRSDRLCGRRFRRRWRWSGTERPAARTREDSWGRVLANPHATSPRSNVAGGQTPCTLTTTARACRFRRDLLRRDRRQVTVPSHPTAVLATSHRAASNWATPAANVMAGPPSRRFRTPEGSGAVARWTRWVPLTGCRRAPGPFTIHLYGADRDGQR